MRDSEGLEGIGDSHGIKRDCVFHGVSGIIRDHTHNTRGRGLEGTIRDWGFLWVKMDQKGLGIIRGYKGLGILMGEKGFGIIRGYKELGMKRDYKGLVIIRDEQGFVGIADKMVL